ncbi:putative RNA polymerase II mediator complex component Srb8 [Aspergillus heteromorphus CBS 117.55]|uniref:Putative RNA polymerase II mediator complex component Srb8 n=1 Tax=Aspergillus heteromorphus CBS 117.55 TaxID=1448321 RepID=A0A317WK29_9EURO|nr:putative RNA polymerase II mediator complex component Srb8 [Aspergillus heteromorphus CBS 117.55]PWY86713.1 putative RNA polymerase II mediator complex component Srb8 [Aspergillus heteromorphus CBS 117.55]
MGVLQEYFINVRSSVPLQIGSVVCLLLAYPIYQGIYNVYFHPLAKYPGPKAWAASRIPFVYHLLSGTLVKRQRELHEKYGPHFRMAPDEISFASEEAWHDIYAWRPGHKRAIRDPAFMKAPAGQADNIITTSNVKFHARVRGLMSHSFTDDALREQAPLIEAHADTFINQLWSRATAPGSEKTGGLVNLTDWLNFFTMDVIGDLAFGEAFGCLDQGEYHDWVRTLFFYLKGMTIAAAPRYWPWLEFIFEKLLPRRIMEAAKIHQKYAFDRINRRLESKTERPDFMTPFMKRNPNFESMSRDEILSSFTFIIVGGSETTATSMTGIFNHLCKPESKEILARLTRDIRAAYAEEKEITLAKINTVELPYLDAVINEGLRIAHPVPAGLPRVVPPGGDEYAGVPLPEGTRIGVRTFAVNRSTKYFHAPDTFAPDRWLPEGERPAEFAGDKVSASKPFSVGFHVCLGRPLAWLEMRLILTRTLWAFDIAEEQGIAVRFDDFPTMMMVEKQAMMMRFKARNVERK